MNSNYFSWSNIAEVADIDAHIKYASALLGKYDWQPDAKRLLQSQLQTIIDKQNDKLLNICVIGEFSTGKSSFINALVGYELLAVNVIQGTTVAITIIEYSEQFALKLTYSAGKSVKKTYASIAGLRADLLKYTTDPTYGKTVSYVTVTLPSDILKKGFRIIDTPGTNSLELWHEEVTKRAINNLADLSIVLTDATQPMPRTLIAFADSTLGEAVKHCAFVANKIDLIKEGERQGIIKYIRTKITEQFEIESPFVLPFSSVAATNFFAKDKVPVDNDSRLLTFKSIEELQKYTAQQRLRAQARKVLKLTDRMYTTLNTQIKGIVNDYNKQLKFLDNSKQTDLKPFISEQIALRQKNFLAKAKEKRLSIEVDCDTKKGKAISAINGKISDTKSIDNLSDYVKGSLAGDIEKEGGNIANVVTSRLGSLDTFFATEIKLFQKDFEKEFKKLKILAVKFDIKTGKVSVSKSANQANLESVTVFISDELSKENWAFFGSAATGAIIGSILPGIGTIIGGIIGGITGFIAGAVAAPDIEAVKPKVESKLSTPMATYYRSVVSDCLTDYDNYVNAVNNQIKTEINKYYTAYNTTVQQRIDEWKKQYKGIENKRQMAQKDLNTLSARRQSIKNLISKI